MFSSILLLYLCALILLCFPDVVSSSRSGARAQGKISGREQCEKKFNLAEAENELEIMMKIDKWVEQKLKPGYDQCLNPIPRDGNFYTGANGETRGSISGFINKFHPNLVNDQTYLLILETYKATKLLYGKNINKNINKNSLENFVITYLTNVDNEILNKHVPFNYPDECENPANRLVLKDTLCSSYLLKHLDEICDDNWCKYTESNCTGYSYWKMCVKTPTKKTMMIQQEIQKLKNICDDSEQSGQSGQSEQSGQSGQSEQSEQSEL